MPSLRSPAISPQVLNSNALVNTTTLGSCTSSSPCGPDYGGSGFNGRSTSSDPYYQHGALSQCTKGNVIIITDGEPCSDGNLPSKLAHFADTPTNTMFRCTGVPVKRGRFYRFGV